MMEFYRYKYYRIYKLMYVDIFFVMFCIYFLRQIILGQAKAWFLCTYVISYYIQYC